MNYGERVKAARIARGLTLEQMALDIEMDYRSLARIEKGERNPRSISQRKISDYLGDI